MRFDYQSAWTERWNRFSNFDPTVPNPGAGGLPGAMVFAGSGPGRTGKNTFDKIPLDAGYGIYYSGVAFLNGPTTLQGFQTIPTAPNVTNGLYRAFSLDSGFPRNLITYPPIIDPTVANGTSPQAYVASGNTLPRYQNWSFTVQRQLSSSILLDVSYTGNHGTRLPQNPNYLGVLSNMNNPSILALGSKVLGADINSDIAKAAGISPPYPGFVGNVAQALRPFPQYQGIGYRDWPIGFSIYHSLQVMLDKRFSNGMLFRAFYTRSKLINDGAEQGYSNGGGTAPQNPINTQQLERAVSADDVPNTFVFTWSYELPFGKHRQHDVIYKLISGWTVNGILRYESGRPERITMANDMGGLLFNPVKRPNVVTGISALSDAVNNGTFDPNKNVYFNRGAWSDPGPLTFGNAPPRDAHVRGFPNAVEDANLFKETKFGEKLNWRLEIEGGNFTNRVVFCDPNTNWSAGANFGLVSTQCNQPRSIQLGTKLTF
jgi:hypothetical protein